MEITESPIARDRLAAMAAARFGDRVKAVADIERRVMVVDAEVRMRILKIVGGSVAP